MIINSLHLENLRNIKSASISLGEGVNVFLGVNGSGKSSLLESAHVLATGKSFRTSKIDNLKNFDSDYFTISSNIKRNGLIKTVGFRKDKSSFDIRVNAKNVNRLSELALNFSLVTFHSNSIFLIEGEPQYRRRYIDWWLFHSENKFYSEWLRYQKLLKQRNAALRKEISYMHVWEESLAESGEILNLFRKSAVEILMDELISLINNNNYSSLLSGFSWQYNYGWPKDETLASSLKRNRQRDIQYGFTSVGPHRSDLRFLFHGKDAKDMLSRGQQKTLSLLMLMALASIHKKLLNETPAFMVDDISSELDSAHRYNLIEQIIDFGGQLLLTAIDENDLKIATSTPISKFVLQEGEVLVL
ncbi:MAG: hypothetical protein B7Y40_01230 [Gammaproteobacteria bacterium 28-57-27]|nr:MAG: hypothetical protein B7Y40_01230 [Gammaproteobacteria bacterium 28-57-27]